MTPVDTKKIWWGIFFVIGLLLMGISLFLQKSAPPLDTPKQETSLLQESQERPSHIIQPPSQFRPLERPKRETMIEEGVVLEE